MAQASGARPSATSEYGQEAGTSGMAVGFTIFAAAMMMMIGFFHMIAGFAAVFENEFFVVTPNYLFEFDVTVWGWIHLIGGIVVLAASFGLFGGGVASRTVGVIVAGVSAVANFLWLPYYPVWSIVMIAVAIMVIWALTVHGGDMKEA